MFFIPELEEALNAFLDQQKPESKYQETEQPKDSIAESEQGKLDPFRFDAAPDTPEAERINNMAWEFMQADGMSYQEAIRVAAEICGNCDVAPCEAAYESVRALWRRITGTITDTPHVSYIVGQLNKPFPNRQA